MEVLPAIIGEVNKTIEQEVSCAIEDIDHKEFIPFLTYAVKAKKDYDRALMVRLGCDVTRGDWHIAIPAMTCAELMDFSIAVIDDILDLSSSRLGKPALFEKWDTRYAINVAFILKCLADEVLIKQELSEKIGSNRLVRIVSILETSHREIYEGQFLDVKFEELPYETVTLNMYLEMIKYTSGLQGAAYCQIGGIISGAPEKEIESLKKYGRCIGTIFQIRDDFIDYLDSEQEIGKPSFRDFLQKKRRLPIILAWKYSSQAELDILSRLMEKRRLNKGEKRQILSIILKDEVVKESKSIVQELEEEAMNALKVFKSDTKAKKALIELLRLGSSL